MVFIFLKFQVIQSLGMCPRLVGFVMNILNKLINKQVRLFLNVIHGFPSSSSLSIEIPTLSKASFIAKTFHSRSFTSKYDHRHELFSTPDREPRVTLSTLYTLNLPSLWLNLWYNSFVVLTLPSPSKQIQLVIKLMKKNIQKTVKMGYQSNIFIFRFMRSYPWCD